MMNSLGTAYGAEKGAEKAIESGQASSVRLLVEKGSKAVSSAMVFAIQRDDRKLLAFLQRAKAVHRRLDIAGADGPEAA